jgi:hypothetical protein
VRYIELAQTGMYSQAAVGSDVDSASVITSEAPEV